MKKRIMALVMMCAMLVTMTACGGKKGNATLSYEFPEGFTEQSENMWYAPDYPNDTSNVIIQSLENDAYGANYTEDQFVELITQAYTQQGYTVDDINVAEFTKAKMEGYDTLLAEISYNLAGIDKLLNSVCAPARNSCNRK